MVVRFTYNAICITCCLNFIYDLPQRSWLSVELCHGVNLEHKNYKKTRLPSFSLLILLSLLTALDAIAIDTYLPGMPAIADDFSITSGRVQQTLSVFLAGLAMGQAFYGPLLDRYGRRLPLLTGIFLFVAGSSLAAVAPTVEWLIAARFIQAVGAAAGLVTPRAIVSDLYNMADSARIYSILMQIMMIAPVLAPVIGGFLLEHTGWRAIFWMLAAFGTMGFIWCIFTLPESHPADKRTALSFMKILQSYAGKITHIAFIAYTVAGGLILGSLFAYISGSAFVFTNYFLLTPLQFSYLYAGISVCLLVGGEIGNSLFKRGLSAFSIMCTGISTHILMAGLLFILVSLNSAPLMSYILLVGATIGALGLVFGNMTALTMEHAGSEAGVASALMGSLQYLLSALIGYIISLKTQNIVNLPMVMSICGILALTACLLARRSQIKGEKK